MKNRNYLFHFIVNIVLLFSFFSHKLGIVGFFILIPTLLLFPGILLIKIIEYELSSKSKKLAYSFVISCSITISLSYFLAKVSETINYQIFLIILIVITLILEGICLYKDLRGKKLTEIKKEIIESFKEFEDSFRLLNHKRKIIPTLVVVLILVSMCFPLFFKKQVPFYVFSFDDDPPLETFETSLNVEILIEHLNNQNHSVYLEVLVNNTQFADEIVQCSNTDTTKIMYVLDFTQNGSYFILFNFYAIHSNVPEEIIGSLFFKVQVAIKEI